MTNNNNTKVNTMNITESKTEINVNKVNPMDPQIICVLDKKGLCIAFVCVGFESTTVQIGLCQDENFELELDKD